MATGGFEGAKTAAVNGANLAYRDAGRGEPVVLVHGTASDMRIWTDPWDGNLPDFGDRFRVIAYSRRYARPNEDIPLGVDDQMLPHVDDLIAFLKAVDAEPAHLIGHSWGGVIALIAAIRAPGSVKSLVLMEPPAMSLFVSTPPRPMELLKLLLSRPATAMAILKFGGGAVAPAIKAFRGGDEMTALEAFGRGVLGARFDSISEVTKQRLWENRSSARAQLLGAGFPPLADNDVRAVTKPALLVIGTESPRLFQCIIERLEELLPIAERVVIADASHAMQEDQPAAWTQAMCAFLERQT
jgi:pimeloyl-ACP methyl ester carboxylesterase